MLVWASLVSILSLILFDRFYYGVCYYPEAWDAKRHADDIPRIAECGFNYVRMGEGAWSYWEPREGEFQFDLFDRVIDLCRKHGVKVILGTPTYAAPAWVSHKYPEVLRWDYRRVPMKHGSRRNLNYTSRGMLELSDRICTALAQHYKREKQVIGWQLDNEFNCHMDVSYAPSDTLAFRAWLKVKYKSIAKLNDAWGTRFWSQTYDDWEQIDLPHPTATYHNPTQLLDESRFISDTVVAFAKRQAAILRAANPKWPITHNGLFNNVNGRDLVTKTPLDFFSHDQYPLFYRDWTDYAFNLVQARSLSFPFGIMEQQSGPGGQMDYLHRTPRPGEMRLWAWQSIAHGANVFSYFRWRTCPYGSEQHWHGLLDPDDKLNRRTTEAKQVAEELKRLPKDFFAARVEKCFAVLRDYDNEINERRINTYAKSGAWENGKWLAALAHHHVQHDIVWPDQSFEGYRVLIAPHLKIMDVSLARKLERFVRAGGILILAAQSGLKDRNCHLVERTPPGLLARLAGVEVEEWTTLPVGETRTATPQDGDPTLRFTTFVERLRLRAAEAVLTWTNDDAVLGGGCAVARNRVGKGVVYYVGGYSPAETAEALLTFVRLAHPVAPVVEASGHVEVIARRSGRRRYLILLNHGSAEQNVLGLRAGRELISGKRIAAQSPLVVASHGVAIVEQR